MLALLPQMRQKTARISSRRGLLTRRVQLTICLIFTFLLLDVSSVLVPIHRVAATPASGPNPIQIENSNPGTPGWNDFASSLQPDLISGFGSKISVNHGDSIDFYVTTTEPSFTIDIFRTGYYQGIGARLITSLGSFPGVHQPIPAPDPVTGMIACTSWAKTTTLQIPSSWVTGVYLAKLTTSTGYSSFIFFVVRNDGGTEDIVFQTSVTTYQAYNTWGGTSLYNNLLTNKSLYPYAHATKVSFDRPFNPGDSNGAGHYLFYEYHFVHWLESQGYNITYITDVDTDTNVNPLTNHKAFLSIGHDEYWSKGMRDNVQNAINAGVNVAFFSGNSVYWQIRFESNAAGAPDRVEVGYKDFATFNILPGPDPMWNVNNAIVTTNWRDPTVNQPENALMGVMYEQQVDKDYAYVVQNASSWIYANTGFVDGSSVPGIVGYEYDKVWNNGFSPAGLTVLSNSPVHGCCGGFSSYANSSLYIASSGARVFAAGTIQWSWGLANVLGNTYANAGIQQTTANILNNFINGPTPGVYLNPSSLSFGTQLLNTTSTAQTVTLTNNGTAILTLNGISVTGSNASDFAETDNCPPNQGTMAVGASCIINVTFTPSATGVRNASLSLADNAAGSPQTVPLSGNGTNVDAPAVSLNPSNLTFSSQLVGTTSASQVVTLTDSGTQPLAINSINLNGTNAGDFVQTNNCPSTLAANTSCAITVTFTPGDTGSRSASITLTDNALDSPQSLALSGTGTNVLFSDGFESGRLPGSWTSKKVTSGNKLGLDTTLKHSGGASLKSYVVKGIGGNAYVSKTIIGQTTLDVRGYYYLNSPINIGAVNLLSLYGQGSFIGWVTYNVSTTSPTLTVKNAANSSVYTCSGVPSLNAWHSLELQYVLSSTSAGSFTVWLDGVQVCGAININTAQTSGQTIGTVIVGSYMSDNTVGLKMHVDDVVVSKSYIGT